jgi:hypothetical protein
MSDFLPKPLSVDGRRASPSGEAEKLFRANRKLLLDRYGLKVAALKSVDFKKSAYTTISAADGFPTLIGFDGRGQIKVLDELGQPAQARREWFDSLTTNWNRHTIFLGFGVGHLAASLASKLDEMKSLVILEPVPDILALACATYDLSPVVENEKVSFWTPEDSYEAADWIFEWIEETKAMEDPDTAFYLHPSFVVSSPEFLWGLAVRLSYRYQRFETIAALLPKRYPEPPEYSEDWAACLHCPGIARLEGKGKSSPAIVLGEGSLSEGELELVAAASEQGHLVIASARRFADCPDGANTVVCGPNDPAPSGLPATGVPVASAVAVCRFRYPDGTLVYWAEGGPTVRRILPPYCTPQLLAEKGMLAMQPSPMGTAFDLAVHLGCSPILLAGFEGLEEPTKQKPNLTWIALREQVRRSDREALCVSESAQVWVEEAKRVEAGEISRRWKGLPVFNLREESKSIRLGFEDLPKPRFPIDRSLKAGGTELLDRQGRMLAEPEPQVLEAIFHHNYTALQKSLPQLAQTVAERVQAQTGEEVYRLGKGPEGFPFLSIQTPEGRPVATLPGGDDPWRLVAETEFWKKTYTECGNVFLGIGLGFFLEALLERYQGSIVLWEPVVDRLMAAMHVRNLEPLFSHPRLAWLVGRTPQETIGHLINNRMTETFRAPPNWQPIVEPELRPALAGHVRDFKADFADRNVEIRSARAALKMVVADRAKSYLRNSIRTANAIPMDRLTGRFQGVPAIVVAAGPSLDENVHLLNEVKDRAIIIVVDTSFRVVQPRDIDRHFVASIDPKQESRLHFEDRQPREEDILLATTGTPEEIWDLFPDPKVFGDFLNEQEPTPLLAWLSEVLDYEISRFWGGGSVAISSLGAAHQMGCDPLILIGQDLAVLPDRTHASDTIYPEKSKQGRAQQEKEVPALGGGTVKSTASLLAMKANLEHQIRWNRLNVINSTAFGARIVGTREIPFQEVLAALASERIPVRKKVLDLAAGLSPKRVDRMGTALRDWKKEIEILDRESRKMIARLQGLIKKLERGGYPNNCNKASEDILKDLIKVGFNSPALRRMEDFFYFDALTYVEHERRIKAAPDGQRKLKWQAARTLPLLEALQRAIEQVLAEIDLVVGRLVD